LITNLKSTCHRTGDKVVATGTEGADGVCVLMIYCSGAAYLHIISEFESVALILVLLQFMNLKAHVSTLDPKGTHWEYS
jgi:hypothetical protein